MLLFVNTGINIHYLENATLVLIFSGVRKTWQISGSRLIVADRLIVLVNWSEVPYLIQWTSENHFSVMLLTMAQKYDCLILLSEKLEIISQCTSK